MLSFVNCMDVPYFSTLSHKRRDFRKQVIEHDICVLIPLHRFSDTFLLIKKTAHIRLKTYIGLHVKYQLFLSDFNET
jgi:hypothetical protein